ncbi:MAG: MOSC domain-containing protein [Rhodobacteraceae bacterium]|nr:MOSC domain-containing protein [Paracoccaceae bacterium]
MPALMKTSFTAEVVWLGAVQNDDRKDLLSETANALDLTFAGVGGAFHSGLTRASCSRVKSQYAVGTEIRNTRQLSIVSAEELEEIAATLELDQVDPARLGATVVVRGLPDFTHLPPSSRLTGPSGVSLTVDMENRPCQFPAKSLETAHPGHGKGFKAAAKGKRGVTAWVEREGRLSLGDTLTLHIPDQPAWAHMEAARLG